MCNQHSPVVITLACLMICPSLLFILLFLFEVPPSFFPHISQCDSVVGKDQWSCGAESLVYVRQAQFGRGAGVTATAPWKSELSTRPSREPLQHQPWSENIHAYSTCIHTPITHVCFQILTFCKLENRGKSI